MKAARALLGWSQDDLAMAAELSVPTVKRLEASDGLLGGRDQTVEKIVNAITSAGVDFIFENGGGPGVRLRRSGKSRA
ncbi:helix-turn-helix transcriptional regulator [Bradyrhizobium sp. LB5.2]|uniref:helix-turn-helix transcriptional regulator n=1 Tax=unclassified Bradyrhizobium TaxID=2631580 RepID=UPI003391C624